MLYLRWITENNVVSLKAPFKGGSPSRCPWDPRITSVYCNCKIVTCGCGRRTIGKKSRFQHLGNSTKLGAQSQPPPRGSDAPYVREALMRAYYPPGLAYFPIRASQTGVSAQRIPEMGSHSKSRITVAFLLALSNSRYATEIYIRNYTGVEYPEDQSFLLATRCSHLKQRPVTTLISLTVPLC